MVLVVVKAGLVLNCKSALVLPELPAGGVIEKRKLPLIMPFPSRILLVISAAGIMPDKAAG